MRPEAENPPPTRPTVKFEIPPVSVQKKEGVDLLESSIFCENLSIFGGRFGEKVKVWVIILQLNLFATSFNKERRW